MASKQSDTAPVSAAGGEELECDVVGISKRQCRVGRRVHDATVEDAELVKTDFPCLQLIAVGTAESQMIEPRPPLVERLSAVQVRELSYANDCAGGKPSHALERTCVLVEDWVRAEQILVPRHTPFKARNR